MQKEIKSLVLNLCHIIKSFVDRIKEHAIIHVLLNFIKVTLLMPNLTKLEGHHCRASIIRVASLERLPDCDEIIAIGFEEDSPVGRILVQLNVADSCFFTRRLALHYQ